MAQSYTYYMILNKLSSIHLFLCLMPFFSFGQVQDSLLATNMETTRISSFAVPAVFIGYGIVSLAGNNAIRRLDYTTNNELREDHPTFALKLDNITRYTPAVAVYGLDLVGVKAKHSVIDRSIMLLMSAVIAQTSVNGIKSLSHRMRPNGSASNSFPSGHTSFAFMSAEFLNQEYKDQSVWYGIGGYAIATGTGILRLYNNAHWVSDVVAGAGFGILSTKLTYLIYPYIKQKIFRGKPANLLFNPSFQNGNISFSLIKRL